MPRAMVIRQVGDNDVQDLVDVDVIVVQDDGEDDDDETPPHC